MAPLDLKGALPVRFRRAAFITLFALATLPAAAQAAAPLNDNFLSARVTNTPGTVLPQSPQFAQWSIGAGGNDSAGVIDQATTQGNMGDSNNTPEDLTCEGVPAFGKTVWYMTFPDVSGWIQARVSGGDAVVRLLTVATNGTAPNFADSVCVDDPTDFTTEELFTGVVGGPGRRYAIQVGVYQSDTWGASQHLTRITFYRDRDLDATFDTGDRCPTTSGPQNLQGCPDTDSDGIVNIDDRCPTTRGLAALRGCTDGDGDGVADPDDRCPTQSSRAADSNRDGCLDVATKRLDRTVLEDFGGFSTARSYRITKFVLQGVPKGARIVAKCRRRNGRSCGSQTISKATVSGASGPQAQAAKSRKLKRFVGKVLRRGSAITVRVTANRAIGRYIKITIVKKGRFLGKKVYRGCMNQGAKTKFKKKGCK